MKLLVTGIVAMFEELYDALLKRRCRWCRTSRSVWQLQGGYCDRACKARMTRLMREATAGRQWRP